MGSNGHQRNPRLPVYWGNLSGFGFGQLNVLLFEEVCGSAADSEAGGGRGRADLAGFF